MIQLNEFFEGEANVLAEQYLYHILVYLHVELIE